MIYRISRKDKSLRGSIHLTSSKSESNRALVIRELCKDKFEILNLSDSQDTQTLQESLRIDPHNILVESEFNVGAAGTTMRFLMALYAIRRGRRILTGTERMKQRPVKILVEALRQLGAEIEYLGKEGYPPVRIIGREIKGGTIEIDGSVSSQYISALLMIAPVLPLGLVIHFKGEVASKPYINMTLRVMESFGVAGIWQDNSISVSPQNYYIKEEPAVYEIEADWSAASYWYAMASLSDEVDLVLTGLKKSSLQGDAVLPDLFNFFGVKTEFVENGIRLTKGPEIPTQRFGFDFNDCPDIAQTIAVLCALHKIPCLCKGLSTLKIKETDRALALKQELQKIGSDLEILSDDAAKVLPGKSPAEVSAPIKTYEDHRMAMAFSALACVYDKVLIEHPEVVKKSYPTFWSDLKKVGFTVEEVK
jgi:3-phosphoshikimate 1-carboxyvinyltransferase